MAAPLVRFGVIADPQYADLPPWRNRHYRHSLTKLAEAVDTLNDHDLAFVITLGDVIDRDWASFDAILPLYARSRHPTRFVLGNHDFSVGAEHLGAVKARLGLARGHYAFDAGTIRFVVVDGTEISVFANPVGSPNYHLGQARLAALEAAGAVNGQPWNGGMGPAQKAWFRAELAAAAAAGRRVIVLGHYPVFPIDEHNMWDDADFVATLTASPTVLAHFSGHNHAGNYGVLGGKHFVNLKGMVETVDATAFAVIEVHHDRLAVRGFGQEPTRTLPL